MTEEHKKSLTEEDWKALLPGEEYKLGGKIPLKLRPLNITEVGKVLRVVDEVKDTLKNRKITLRNYSEAQNLVFIASLMVDKLPEMISDCAGIAIEDVKRIPIDPLVELLSALILVNEKSRDSLIKNLTALGEAMLKLVTTQKAAVPPPTGSETPPSS